MTLDLDKLERLERAATGAPWYLTGAPWFRCGDGILAGSADGNIGLLIADCSAFTCERGDDVVSAGVRLGEADDDADLIVALRNAAPAMIARIRELERKVAERDARIGELRAALKPFGDNGRMLAERLRDEDFTGAWATPTVGQLRTAAFLTADDRRWAAEQASRDFIAEDRAGHLTQVQETP